MSLRVLVIDDEKLIRVTTTRQLIEAGYQAEAHESPFNGLTALERGSWDVVLTDLRMPSMDGIQFLKEIKTKSPDTVVILMTAYGTVETAVEAMRSGAFDFLTKPFSFQELKIRLERVEQTRQIRREIDTLRKTLGPSHVFCGLVGVSPQMRRVFELIAQFAENPSNVLIVGETGTGKELVAQALHARSSRSGGPFVTLPCGAIPQDMAASELFGHEAGAFPNARQHKGRVEQARGGTLFLDDIDDLPFDLQPKLRRVIQERQFERVGGEEVMQADARIIAATKVDLQILVLQKRFREDLYYRLKVLTIILPALRERTEDIPFLAQHFVDLISKERNAPPKRFSDNATRKLMIHDWPGNVRELRHVVEYAMAVCTTPEIEIADLPQNLQTVSDAQPYRLNLSSYDRINFNALTQSFERDLLLWALKQVNGNQGKAAELLGIPRTTFQSKLNTDKTPLPK
jgi:DNA-binding NtrC family response regulator